MNRNNYASITILTSIMLMPQLFFWWLAPQTADSYWAVFACGTFFTLVIPAVCFAVYVNSNIRESACLIVVSGIIEIVTIALTITLLALNASIRTTLFVFGIELLVSLLVIVPFAYSILNGHRNQDNGINNTMTIDYRNLSDNYEPKRVFENRFDSVRPESYMRMERAHEESGRTASVITDRMPLPDRGNRSLPPRN